MINILYDEGYHFINACRQVNEREDDLEVEDYTRRILLGVILSSCTYSVINFPFALATREIGPSYDPLLGRAIAIISSIYRVNFLTSGCYFFRQITGQSCTGTVMENHEPRSSTECMTTCLLTNVVILGINALLTLPTSPYGVFCFNQCSISVLTCSFKLYRTLKHYQLERLARTDFTAIVIAKLCLPRVIETKTGKKRIRDIPSVLACLIAEFAAPFFDVARRSQESIPLDEEIASRERKFRFYLEKLQKQATARSVRATLTFIRIQNYRMIHNVFTPQRRIDPPESIAPMDRSYW